MDLTDMPKIEVDFIIEGTEFDLEKFTDDVSITPTLLRTKEDWPDTLKNNQSLPKELKPRYIWGIGVKEEKCKKVEIPIGNIISKLTGKEKKIIELCKKNNLMTGLCITIHGETMNLPEIVLSPDIISYFALLESEISFDIYTYSEME